MVRLEELPDDFDENVNLNEAPSAPSIEELYNQHINAPERQAISDKSFEEIVQEMSKTPLFMNSLDEATDDDGQNTLIEAIKALQYEGTKAEIAQGFKERGNEMVAEKKWSDAKEFYSKGIAVLVDKSEDKWDKPADMEAEMKQRKALEEQLYTNRALCNLELKNYRSTILDCAAAIRINPSNVKAHYRSASALLALDKVLEALDVASRGAKIDPDNTPLKNLLERIRTRAKAKEEQDRRRQAELRRKQEEKAALEAALKARKISVRGSKHPPNLEDAVIHLSPDPASPTSTLEFPVMLLYPMHNQSDFIKAWSEKDTINQHLDYILPLPWDSKNEYKPDTVECYMDTISGGLVKIGKKLTLLEALSNGKTEIVDGLVRIYVVPTSMAAQWIEEVKRKKGR
ncbi:Hsp70/Hsp90 co-chaperone cns1 [Exophiala dermatitidis]|uniref:Protein phosphatase 5 n=1 Tax=Exophiala dermatitidis (strain ATCC 34100 / CBS 525.76 / NIH/UT8656) TaxID=858893 RepID=H6C4Z0_EXODN|nr:protein phosphatase 5 [Exophiala dermatitidis NIH/UT8656]EHY58891.1 protein phosphatase 5 [Exophiala dermatitidis NIH/UT8656]